MASKMAIVVLVFTYAGIKLDAYFQPKFALFTLFGALLGSIMGIYSAIRDLTR